jgi:uncharacterized cofD-like protein
MSPLTGSARRGADAAPPTKDLVPAPRVVAIGGGTGLPAVLRGLRDAFSRPPFAAPDTRGNLTAIVTVTDDGGSSGLLRRELGVLPPGDIRNCLVALAENQPLMTNLLQHRLQGGNGLNGHAVGNLMLAALTQMNGGDFARAVEQLSEILALRGRVLPSTAENIRITAEFECGAVVDGETAITRRGGRIKRLALERQVRPLPETIQALINADAVVIGPGSLYTSILPNLLIDGIASTLSGVRAVRIYVANLMTEPGETDGFSLEDHLAVIREHVGHDLFDCVLVNRRPIDPAIVEHYGQRGSVPVRYSTRPGGPALVESDLAAEMAGEKIRHSSPDLACAVLDLVQRRR